MSDFNALRARALDMRRMELRAVLAFEKLHEHAYALVREGLAAWAVLEKERDDLIAGLWTALGMTEGALGDLSNRLFSLDGKNASDPSMLVAMGKISNLADEIRSKLGITEDLARWDAADLMVRPLRDAVRNRSCALASAQRPESRVGAEAILRQADKLGPPDGLPGLLLLANVLAGDEHGAGSQIELLELEIQELRGATDRLAARTRGAELGVKKRDK